MNSSISITVNVLSFRLKVGKLVEHLCLLGKSVVGSVKSAGFMEILRQKSNFMAIARALQCLVEFCDTYKQYY